MATQKSELGAKGESAACLFLERKGYRIIERNARKPWGELDIVVKAPDGTLVLVEVKTLRQAEGMPSDEQLLPEDNMTKEKMEKFRRAASLYAGFRHELMNNEKGWRLDVIATAKNNHGYQVRHYENV